MDTKELLILVLQKIFHNCPKIVEKTYQIIDNYNEGLRGHKEYEETLKTICKLMDDKLPSQILVYVLTLVDIPKDENFQLPIIQKMQKTQDCLKESIRPQLIEYLECHPKDLPKNVPAACPKKQEIREQKRSNGECAKASSSNFVRPAKRPRTRRKLGKVSSESSEEGLGTLLDICATFVVRNETILKNTYKKLQETAWNMINSNAYSGKPLKQCYEVVRDLNKKTKLLRMIENNDMSDDILFEEYRTSDIFLKEKHMYEVIYHDPFSVTEELMDGIKLFLEK